MRKECYYCHSKTKDKLIEKFDFCGDKLDKFSKNVDSFLQHYWHLENPLISMHIQRMAKEILHIDDLYKSEKHFANSMLMATYSKWEETISSSDNPFHTALKLAVIGNIIDYGAHVVPESIEDFIESQLLLPLAVDDAEQLRFLINDAQSVLYLGDNSGEIVFDKLFIETMNHTNVTFAVRELPVINDVTRAEAAYVGMDSVCRVISNGYDAPSTLLDYCSDDFKSVFNKADLIISKGQGNFEGLMNTDKKNICFMLMAKCEPIAEMLGVEKGSMVVKLKQQKR